MGNPNILNLPTGLMAGISFQKDQFLGDCAEATSFTEGSPDLGDLFFRLPFLGMGLLPENVSCSHLNWGPSPEVC